MLKQMMSVIVLSLFSFSVWAGSVNINQASADTLAEQLTGVGQVKAKRIVDYREAEGAFEDAQSLTQVKGIGPKTVANNKESIKVD